jgi:hypothetical protein
MVCKKYTLYSNGVFITILYKQKYFIQWQQGEFILSISSLAVGLCQWEYAKLRICLFFENHLFVSSWGLYSSFASPSPPFLIKFSRVENEKELKECACMIKKNLNHACTIKSQDGVCRCWIPICITLHICSTFQHFWSYKQWLVLNFFQWDYGPLSFLVNGTFLIWMGHNDRTMHQNPVWKIM